MTLTAGETAEKVALESRFDTLLQKEWLSPTEAVEYDRVHDRLTELHRQEAERPTPLGVPAPPLHPAAPVNHHRDDPAADSAHAIENAPPVTGETLFLPLTGNATYDDQIRAMDKALQSVNDSAFRLNPQDLWEYDAAHLGGPAGPSTISSLTKASEAFNGATGKLDASFSEITGITGSHGDDSWSKRMTERYQPVVAAAHEGFGSGGRGVTARGHLDACGREVQDVFSTFRGSITASRDSIAGLYGIDEHGNRYLDTTRPLSLNTGVAEDARRRITALAGSAKTLGGSLDGWSLLPAATAAEVPTTPLAGSAGGGGTSPFPSGGSPSDGLGGAPSSAMGGGMPAGSPSMPMMPSMPSPQMPFDPSALNAMTHPPAAAGDTQLSADTSVPRDVAVGAPDEAKAPRADMSTAAGHNAAVVQIPSPGDVVRPGQLGADGKPLDKNGDGLMDDDALAATKENCDLDGDGVRDNFIIPIDNGERSVDVMLNDPRLAEMMTRLADATPANPLSLMDAAALSGVDIADLGQEIDVMGLSAGDIVEGTSRGMYMGKGLVLSETGEMLALEDVMDYEHSNPMARRLDLPDLPSTGEVIPSTPAAADVSAAPTPAPAATPTPVAMPDSTLSGNSVPATPSEPTRPATPPSAAKGGAAGIEEVPYQGYAMG